MLRKERNTTAILKDVCEIPGLEAAVVVGRDGFVIESEGSSEEIELDMLGACLATAVNGIEDMGREMEVNRMQDLFIEYGDATIICRPIGDAIVALVAPDASKLGIIRYKIKGFAKELASYF